MASMSESHGPTSGLRYGPPQGQPAPASLSTPRSAPTGGSRRVPAAVWPVAVLAVSGILGVAVGIVVTALGTAGTDDNGFGELGAFLLGAALGVLAFAVTYLVGLAVSARLAFPPGRRALPFALSLAIPALIAAATLTLGAVADSAGTDLPQAVGVMAFIGGVVAAPASFAWAGVKYGRRYLALSAAALAALMVVTTAADIGFTHRQIAKAADRLPLVLFAGASADAPFDGWRRDRFGTVTITDDTRSIAERGQRIYLKYFTPDGVAFLTMHTNIGACQDTTLYTCHTSGTLHGNEIRHYERTSKYGSYPQAGAFDVLVYPDGTAVSVNDESYRAYGTRAGTTTTQILTSLVRVDRHQFERSTGSKLRVG